MLQRYMLFAYNARRALACLRRRRWTAWVVVVVKQVVVVQEEAFQTCQRCWA
jgi:hypothetical protein